MLKQPSLPVVNHGKRWKTKKWLEWGKMIVFDVEVYYCCTASKREIRQDAKLRVLNYANKSDGKWSEWVDVDVETDYLSLSQTYTWDNEIKWVLARKGVEFQVEERDERDPTTTYNY
jgi:hypothetical protein